MKKRAFSILFVLTTALCIHARDSEATLFLNLADEFLGGTVDCKIEAGHCTVYNTMVGPQPGFAETADFPPRWQTIGTQSANSIGRVNAREKISFRFRDFDSLNSASATTTLSRYRVVSWPPEDTTCVVSGVFVASSAHTVSTLGLRLADSYISERLLPVLNFSAETAGPGATIGYHTLLHVIVTNPAGNGDQLAQDGCYKINWVN